MGQAGSTLDSSLSKTELERIGRRFDRQTGGAGKMSLPDLEHMPELVGNPYIKFIFQNADKDNDGYITKDDLIVALEGFGKIYSDDEKLRVAFAMFDMDKDGFVSLEELIDMLRNTVKAHQDPLHVKMIASSLLREYDIDRDGRLSYPEFKQMAAAGGKEPRPFLG